MNQFEKVQLSRADPKKSGSFTLAMVFAYYLFEYARPQEYFAGLAELRLPLVLSILLPIIWLLQADKRILSERLIALNAAFICVIAVTVTFAVNTYHVFHTFINLLIFLLAGAIPLATFVNSVPRLRSFFRFWVILHIFLSVFTIQSSGIGPGGFLGDENDIALALAVCAPIALVFVLSKTASKKSKFFSLIAYISMMAGVVATSSRGGFLALFTVTMGVLLVARSIRVKVLLIIIVLVAGLSIASNQYHKEIESIFDSQNSTRIDRIVTWEKGWIMFKANPIFGVGAGNFPWAVENYEDSQSYEGNRWTHAGRVAHSIYFTVVPELGVIGTGIFVWILALLFRSLRAIRASLKPFVEHDPETEYLYYLSQGMRISLIGFLVAGAFLSVLYEPFLWFLIGFILALKNVADRYVSNDVPQSTGAKRGGNFK